MVITSDLRFAGAALIKRAVAVVVDVVAADLYWRLAALTTGVGDAFVYQAITVVVVAVTDLVSGDAPMPGAAVIDLAVAVVVDVIVASFSLRHAAWRSAGVIYQPVAVVIDSVAAELLNLGEHLTDANAPGVVDAVAHTATADPATRRVTRAIVTRLLHSSVAAIALNRQAAFVDDVVAVVVDAVAAVVRSAQLGWEFTAAAASVQYTFVDLAITVVILSIAALDRSLAADTASVQDALIDLPVAVVVAAIADLITRQDGALALAPNTCFTGFKARRAGAVGERCARRIVTALHAAAFTRAAFIDQAIAIVVDPIAKGEIVGVAVGVVVGVTKGSVLNDPRVTPWVGVVAICAQAIGAESVAVAVFIFAAWGRGTCVWADDALTSILSAHATVLGRTTVSGSPSITSNSRCDTRSFRLRTTGCGDDQNKGQGACHEFTLLSGQFLGWLRSVCRRQRCTGNRLRLL